MRRPDRRPVDDSRRLNHAGLSCEPALLRKILEEVHGLQTFAAHTVKYACPSRGHVKRRLFSQIHRSLGGMRPTPATQPQKTVGSQSQAIRLPLDGGKLHISEHLDRERALQL